MSAQRRRRISGQLYKIEVAESKREAAIGNKGKARGGRTGVASAADAAAVRLCKATEQVHRLHSER